MRISASYALLYFGTKDNFQQDEVIFQLEIWENIKKFRSVWDFALVNSNEMLGGPGIIVKIYEWLPVCINFHVCRDESQKWAFGAIRVRKKRNYSLCLIFIDWNTQLNKIIAKILSEERFKVECWRTNNLITFRHQPESTRLDNKISPNPLDTLYFPCNCDFHYK